MERNIILSVMRLRRLEMNISLINNVARQDALLISKNLLNGHNQIYETERNLAHKIQSSNPTIEGLIYLAYSYKEKIINAETQQEIAVREVSNAEKSLKFAYLALKNVTEKNKI